jgi:hypothetical protein
MVSGLFSAKTVVHLSTAPATAYFEHAVAVCTDTPALNTSTTALIARRVCIISSLISSGTSPNELASLLPAATAEERDARAAIGHHHRRASKQREEVAPCQLTELHAATQPGESVTA